MIRMVLLRRDTLERPFHGAGADPHRERRGIGQQQRIGGEVGSRAGSRGARQQGLAPSSATAGRPIRSKGLDNPRQWRRPKVVSGAKVITQGSPAIWRTTRCIFDSGMDRAESRSSLLPMPSISTIRILKQATRERFAPMIAGRSLARLRGYSSSRPWLFRYSTSGSWPCEASLSKNLPA